MRLTIRFMSALFMISSMVYGADNRDDQSSESNTRYTVELGDPSDVATRQETAQELLEIARRAGLESRLKKQSKTGGEVQRPVGSRVTTSNYAGKQAVAKQRIARTINAHATAACDKIQQEIDVLDAAFKNGEIDKSTYDQRKRQLMKQKVAQRKKARNVIGKS